MWHLPSTTSDGKCLRWEMSQIRHTDRLNLSEFVVTFFYSPNLPSQASVQIHLNSEYLF